LKFEVLNLQKDGGMGMGDKEFLFIYLIMNIKKKMLD